MADRWTKTDARTDAHTENNVALAHEGKCYSKFG